MDLTGKNISWKALELLSDWEKIWNDDSTERFLVFKHSTRCHISSTALKNFNMEMKSTDGITFYYLDLLNFREISNQIAKDTGIEHQSPQVLFIQGGKILYTATHHSIDAEKVTNS